MNTGVDTTLIMSIIKQGVGDDQVFQRAELDVPANGHVVRFIDELYPGIGDWGGVLSVEGGPVAAVALQVGRNSGDFTTAPAFQTAPRPKAGVGTLHFAQFAGGGDFVSSFILFKTNLGGDGPAKGNVAFFDDEGTSWTISLNGLEPTDRSIPFVAGYTRPAVFTTDAKALPASGSVRITMTEGDVYAVARLTFPEGGSATIVPNGPLSGFISPVKRNSAAGLNTRVAISSTGSAVTLNLTLRNANGVEVPSGTAEVELPANGRVARSIDELFPDADTASFQGALTVTADGGTISAAVFRVGSQTGEVMSLPVTQLR